MASRKKNSNSLPNAGQPKDYWATKPIDEIGDEIINQIDKNYEYLISIGRIQLWRKMWSMYYFTACQNLGNIQATGPQNEFKTTNINHFRNILLNLKNLTMTQKESWEAQATNSDSDSQEQCLLAQDLLEYYMDEKKVSRFIETAVEYAILLGEGYVSCEWDATAGDVYGMDPVKGRKLHEGDLSFDSYSPLDIYKDFSSDEGSEFNWIITRKWVNRYDLAAKYPQFADKLRKLPSKVDMINRTVQFQMMIYQETDLVALYTFYHKPTPALPDGRITITTESSDIVLADGPLPYKDIPVYRIVPEDFHGTAFGYGSAFDLATIQTGIDLLHSTILTNQSAFGVQNICAPKGSGLTIQQFNNGMRYIEYDQPLGPPHALNLVQTPPEIFNHLKTMEGEMELISGVNSVARGNPEESLKSGSALALVQNQAVQFSMGLQNNYAQLIEDIGNGVISILKVYATTPRVAAIVGKSNQGKLLSFTGKDIDKINRVRVKMGNPMLDTTAGKVNLADSLAQHNLLENANQYLTVVETGKLEPTVEGKMAQLLSIRAENEALSDGKQVKVLMTDNHPEHVLEHVHVINDPATRDAPPGSRMAIVVQNTLQHIQEHVQQWKSMDPDLMAMLGIAPPPPQGPTPGQPSPQHPPGNPANAAGGPSHGTPQHSHLVNNNPSMPKDKSVGAPINTAALMPGAMNPLTQEAASVRMPKQPKAPK
jgi:hypothetical protein